MALLLSLLSTDQLPGSACNICYFLSESGPNHLSFERLLVVPDIVRGYRGVEGVHVDVEVRYYLVDILGCLTDQLLERVLEFQIAPQSQLHEGALVIYDHLQREDLEVHRQ